MIIMWGDDFTHTHAHQSLPVLQQTIEIYRREAILRNLEHELDFKVSTASSFIDAVFVDAGRPETPPLDVEHADLWRYAYT